MDDPEARRPNLTADNTGVTALEYGIVASLLGLVLVSIFSGLGNTLSMLFGHLGSAI